MTFLISYLNSPDRWSDPFMALLRYSLLFVWCSLWLYPSNCVAQTANVGTLGGTVQTDDGKPLVGAVVTYTPINPYRIDRKRRTITLVKPFGGGEVRTGPSGTFSIPNLPYDSYQVCARGVQKNQLNSCSYGGERGSVYVVNGVSSPNPRLVVRTGTFLRVRVTDESRKLQNGARSQLAVVVKGHGYRTASVESKGAGEEILGLAVPAGATVYLLRGADQVFEGSGMRVNGTKPHAPGEPITLPPNAEVHQIEVRLQ